MFCIKTYEAYQISQCVEALCRSVCCDLGADVRACLAQAQQCEDQPVAQEILRQLRENALIAQETRIPLCQDTGMVVVFADVGQDAHITGGLLSDAVDEGVRRAYREGHFRASVLSPLTRVNTHDNTPAVLHTRLVAGDQITLTVAPKGFGSENMSRLAMLTPAQGLAGASDFIVDTVRIAGGNPCPPVVVGVGIGGTMELACLMAKRCLTRETGAPSHDPTLAALEETLLARINALGIGPMGLGGRTTAL
ncbi:MAG: fumarate hydratase, partial [Clostridia bacterium]